VYSLCLSKSYRKPGNGAPGEIRTHDPMLRRHVLYPSELRARCENYQYMNSLAFLGSICHCCSVSLSRWFLPGFGCQGRTQAEAYATYPFERFLMSRASRSISSAFFIRSRLSTLLESVLVTWSFNSEAS
jgi:hypothetical protein